MQWSSVPFSAHRASHSTKNSHSGHTFIYSYSSQAFYRDWHCPYSERWPERREEIKAIYTGNSGCRAHGPQPPHPMDRNGDRKAWTLSRAGEVTSAGVNRVWARDLAFLSWPATVFCTFLPFIALWVFPHVWASDSGI